jgi:hypothetical protein
MGLDDNEFVDRLDDSFLVSGVGGRAAGAVGAGLAGAGGEVAGAVGAGLADAGGGKVGGPAPSAAGGVSGSASGLVALISSFSFASSRSRFVML